MSTDNIYQAPEAELRVDNSDADEFFTVSTRKFWIMHLLTFGLYDVYWSYRHWEHMKLKRGLSVSPGIRGVFFFFFVYSTLREIQTAAGTRQLDNVPNLKLFGILYYVLFCVSIVLALVLREAILTVIWLQLALNITNNVITGYFFASAQRVANRVVNDAEGEKNSRITALNVVWIVVVLIFNLLSLVNRFGTGA